MGGVPLVETGQRSPCALCLDEKSNFIYALSFGIEREYYFVWIDICPTSPATTSCQPGGLGETSSETSSKVSCAENTLATIGGFCKELIFLKGKVELLA
jgi:hypothetical protein